MENFIFCAEFAIAFRGPIMRNKFLTEKEKSYTNVTVFKNKMNSFLTKVLIV